MCVCPQNGDAGARPTSRRLNCSRLCRLRKSLRSFALMIQNARVNLHEYQAKALLKRFGVTIAAGEVATSPVEAETAARTLGGGRWAVKAQVHAGGRGKGGGVTLCDTPQEVREITGRLLGTRLVTPQTGPEGLPVEKVYVEQASAIARELYLSLLIDRASECVCFVGSAAGGMDIEEVARVTPEKIVRVKVQAALGVMPYAGRRLAKVFGLEGETASEMHSLAVALYRLFDECDASLVEINPLVVTPDGNLLALDAKVAVEDNALFRQPDLAEQRDPGQEDALERRAQEVGLSYVSLDGSIACMVNGAGLAMATMDLIKLQGGEPANFLDVGGAADASRVAEGFRLILSNPNVRAILVNIFGGIVRCDVIAQGILQAVREASVEVPVVARLEGTNAGQARAMLEASELMVTAASDLAGAARIAVEMAA